MKPPKLKHVAKHNCVNCKHSKFQHEYISGEIGQWFMTCSRYDFRKKQEEAKEWKCKAWKPQHR